MKTKTWLRAAGIRAVRTFAQTAAATIGTAVLMNEVNWERVVSTAVLAAILSILTSIGFGMPEANENSSGEE